MQGKSASLVWNDHYEFPAGFYSPTPGLGPFPTQKAYVLNVVPGANSVNPTPPNDCKFEISKELREVTAELAKGDVTNSPSQYATTLPTSEVNLAPLASCSR